MTEKRNYIVSMVLLFLCSFVAILCFSCANYKEVAAVTFTFILFCLPGPFILKNLMKLSVPDLVIFGSISGMAVSCLFVTLFVFVFGWNLFAISACLLLISSGLIWLSKKGYELPALFSSDWSQRHYIILIASLFIVLLSISLPLLNIGKLTEQGHGYTWLIGHDFLWRVTASFSVARGLPAESFDFAQHNMNYYILFYTLPAYAYHILQSKASMESILIVTQVFLSVMFVSVFFATVRNLFKRDKSIAFIMLSSFFTYSYIWIYVVAQRLLNFLLKTYPYLEQKLMISNWVPQFMENSAHSHTFYRFLLVQPHVVIALSILLMGICFLVGFSSIFSL